MNSKVFKYVKLGIGCLSALVALFCVILAILSLVNLDFSEFTLFDVYLILSSLVTVGMAVCYGLVGYALIMGFVNAKDDEKLVNLPALIYAAGEGLIFLLAICFAQGYRVALLWVALILAIGSVVAFFIAKTQTEEKNKYIVYIVMATIAFVVCTLQFEGNGGLGLVCNIFSFMMIMGVCGYYVCKLIPTSNSSNKEDTPKEEAKVEEPKSEEAPKEETKAE